MKKINPARHHDRSFTPDEEIAGQLIDFLSWLLLSFVFSLMSCPPD
jgi:hypothetical protein